MPNDVNNFCSDYSHKWTAQRAELELAGFKFEGPGWYITTDSVLLVTPVDPTDQPWKMEWPEDTLFHFHFFSENPAFAFDQITQAPTRLDTRS